MGKDVSQLLGGLDNTWVILVRLQYRHRGRSYDIGINAHVGKGNFYFKTTLCDIAVGPQRPIYVLNIVFWSSFRKN